MQRSKENKEKLHLATNGYINGHIVHNTRFKEYKIIGVQMNFMLGKMYDGL